MTDEQTAPAESTQPLEAPEVPDGILGTAAAEDTQNPDAVTRAEATPAEAQPTDGDQAE